MSGIVCAKVIICIQQLVGDLNERQYELEQIQKGKLYGQPVDLDEGAAELLLTRLQEMRMLLLEPAYKPYQPEPGGIKVQRSGSDVTFLDPFRERAGSGYASIPAEEPQCKPVSVDAKFEQLLADLKSAADSSINKFRQHLDQLKGQIASAAGMSKEDLTQDLAGAIQRELNKAPSGAAQSLQELVEQCAALGAAASGQKCAIAVTVGGDDAPGAAGGDESVLVHALEIMKSQTSEIALTSMDDFDEKTLGAVKRELNNIQRVLSRVVWSIDGEITSRRSRDGSLAEDSKAYAVPISAKPAIE